MTIHPIPSSFFFTAVKDPAAEQILRDCLPRIAEEAAALADPPAALILGGGYGRGEGGVRRTASGQSGLYNDLDWFVIAPSSCRCARRKRLSCALLPVAEHWSSRLGISVDFGPPKQPEELSALAPTLMYQELRRGHLVMFGDRDLLRRCLPASPAAGLPPIEGLRLMLNRGVGLLLAARALAENRPDYEFIRRNMNKCILGCGDALLLVRHRYCWSAAERGAALADEAILPPQLMQLYPAALAFKFTPPSEMTPPMPDELAQLRRLWCCTLDMLTGNPAPAQPPAMREALHRFCALHHNCGLRAALRWQRRAPGADGFPRYCFDDPVARLLAELYALHCTGTSAGAPCERLLHLWQYFN